MRLPQSQCRSKCGMDVSFWEYRINKSRGGWSQVFCKYCGKWLGNCPLEALDEEDKSKIR